MIENRTSVKVVSVQKQKGIRACAILLRGILAVWLAVSLSVCAGCKRHPVLVSTVTTTPEQEATLNMLSAELRSTMRKAYPKVLTRNFDEFAAMRTDLKIPDPPPGNEVRHQ